LTSAEITLALSRLDQLPEELRQTFLDETAAQIERKRQTQHPIRNPIGFLDWLCSEYSQGNNRLTSLSVRYQEQRQMQQQIENTADQSVQMFEAELNQSATKPTSTKKDRDQDRKSRWGDLNL
jgi:1,2-phenylacetyl-CoA epoxidase catalytic subunit